MLLSKRWKPYRFSNLHWSLQTKRKSVSQCTITPALSNEIVVKIEFFISIDISYFVTYTELKFKLMIEQVYVYLKKISIFARN